MSCTCFYPRACESSSQSQQCLSAHIETEPESGEQVGERLC